jgi:Ca-activated chloride channel family protein
VSFTFAWPYLLFALLAAPLVVAVYLLLLRRRRRFAVSYSSLLLVAAAMSAQSRWRRRLPFALFLLALVSLGIAAARPQAVVAVPINRMSIILAMDVSRSMCATDVEPNRLSIAQEVARNFIEEQERGTRIGLVAFAGTAQLVVPATEDRDALIEAIDGFTAGRGTAIGSALLRSIDAIAETNPDVARSGIDLRGADPENAPASGHEPDIVVLLTDGATTQGVDPIRAAQQAVDRHLRVYTIGFGTAQGGQLICTREQMGSDVFRGQFGSSDGFGGDVNSPRRRILALDEVTLQTIADMTGGSYHRAQDADELVGVFRDLPREVATEREEVELSFAFAALGGLLALAAMGLSLTWNRPR